MSFSSGVPSELENIIDKINYLVENDHLIWKIGLSVIFLLCLNWGIVALIRSKTRGWVSFYYVFLTLAILLWAGGTMFPLFFPASPYAGFIGGPLRQIGSIFIPGLLCLHIWRQVSYKDITPLVAIACLTVPVLYSAYAIMGNLPHTPVAAIAFTNYMPPEGTVAIVYLVYVASMLIKGMLLCLNVFYQMPRHMRRSSYYLLTGISMYLVANFAGIILPPLNFDLVLVAAALMMMCFFDAFYAAVSANVIVTSRDFVFGSLDTMILVLSRENRILDWNKKTIASLAFLPKPIYREPFTRYRRRILEEGSGRVSPHGDNIITTTHENREIHYLITQHEVQNRSRKLGYIVEIAEVTRIYSVLRFLEDIAMVDQLTGLYNRNAYLNMVRRLVYEERIPLLVVVGDVNGLKLLNDTCGHLVGDELLVAVARIIAENAPSGSYACRIGGDEFVLLMPDGGTEDAKKFISVVNKGCAGAGSDRYGTPSISWGYAVREDQSRSYNEVFAEADLMMYSTKRERFQFTSSGMVPPNMPEGTHHSGQIDLEELNRRLPKDEDGSLDDSSAPLSNPIIPTSAPQRDLNPAPGIWEESPSGEAPSPQENEMQFGAGQPSQRQEQEPYPRTPRPEEMPAQPPHRPSPEGDNPVPQPQERFMGDAPGRDGYNRYETPPAPAPRERFMDIPSRQEDAQDGYGAGYIDSSTSSNADSRVYEAASPASPAQEPQDSQYQPEYIRAQEYHAAQYDSHPVPEQDAENGAYAPLQEPQAVPEYGSSRPASRDTRGVKQQSRSADLYSGMAEDHENSPVSEGYIPSSYDVPHQQRAGAEGDIQHSIESQAAMADGLLQSIQDAENSAYGQHDGPPTLYGSDDFPPVPPPMPDMYADVIPPMPDSTREYASHGHSVFGDSTAWFPDYQPAELPEEEEPYVAETWEPQPEPGYYDMNPVLSPEPEEQRRPQKREPRVTNQSVSMRSFSSRPQPKNPPDPERPDKPQR